MEFRHQPLLSGEIRLCRLTSEATIEDNLRLELRHFLQKDTPHFRISQRPAYVALSYTWGPEDPRCYVIVNNAYARIRANLYHFLQCTKDAQEYSWFWIDQLCIDQVNDLERNAVVQQMDTIYRLADSVRIWLGKSTNESNLAFELLGKFAAFEDSEDAAEGEEAIAALITHPRSSMALSDLFSRSYWYRQWIIQEVWLANSVRLQCGSSGLNIEMTETLYGNDHISWCHLDTLMESWTKNSQEKRHQNPIFTRVAGSALNSTNDFVWVNHHFEGECTDPRDKVFGLQGIVHPDQRVTVDYRMPVGQVFWTTVETMYRQPIPKGYWPFLELDVTLDLIKLAKRMGLTGEEFDQTAVFDRIRHIYVRRGWEWRIPDMISHREKFPDATDFEHHV